MDLSLYKPTELEIWIYQKYRSHGIHYAADLHDIDLVASVFRTVVRHTEDDTRIIGDDDFGVILINAFLPKKKKRAAFFHELGHFLRHCGCQHFLTELMEQLQEAQASHFQFYAAMPIYMIEEFIRDVYSHAALEKVLSEEFCLPLSFVRDRIDQIKRRIYMGQIEKEWRERNTDTSHITDEYIQQLQLKFAQEKKQRELLWGMS